MITKWSFLAYKFILLDELTRAMIDPLVECRKLWGGPFNPKFDVCKNLEDTLKKVNCNIHFLSKRLKTQNEDNMSHHTKKKSTEETLCCTDQ